MIARAAMEGERSMDNHVHDFMADPVSGMHHFFLTFYWPESSHKLSSHRKEAGRCGLSLCLGGRNRLSEQAASLYSPPTEREHPKDGHPSLPKMYLGKGALALEGSLLCCAVAERCLKVGGLSLLSPRA